MSNSPTYYILFYKQYIALVDYNWFTGCYCGRVRYGIDHIYFHAHTIEEAHNEFQDSVEEYIAWCDELDSEMVDSSY